MKKYAALAYVFWCAVLCAVLAIMSMVEPDYKEYYPAGYIAFENK